MDRFDFYFEQLVTQADMDEAFDFAESSDHQLQSDNGYVGITQGLDIAQAFPTANLTVDVAAGVAYDQTGQRCYVAAPQNLDVSVDSNAVATTVATPGNEKWLSIFVAFDRTLSDPRVDGNGTPLQYRRAEGYQFIVDQGAESAAGTAAVYTSTIGETFPLVNGETLDISVGNTPSVTVTFLTGDFSNIALATAAEVATVIQANVPGVTAADASGDVAITTEGTGPSASVVVTGGNAASKFGFPSTPAVGAGGPTRPALRADAILLADVLLRNGTTQVFDAPDAGPAAGVIDAATRRETVFAYQGQLFKINEGTITGFADALINEFNIHIGNTGNAHPADAITFDDTTFTTRYGAASEVQAALDALAASAGRIDANETVSFPWTFSNNLTASSNLISTSVASFQGYMRLEGVDEAGVAASFVQPGGISDARREWHMADVVHTVSTGGTSNIEVILADFGANPGDSSLVVIEGQVVCWDDTAVTNESPSSTAESFFILAGVDNGTGETCDLAGGFGGNKRELFGGATDLNAGAPWTVTAPAALGQVGIQINFDMGASANDRNITVMWTVYKARQIQ